MEKVSLIIDKKECMGCHACEIACKQEHQLGVGPQLISVMEEFCDFIPVYCRHCARAPCGDVCPVDAISRNDRGIVLIDKDTCIGCRDCLEACPFGAMQFNDTNETAIKCDLCIGRLEDNKKPACMSICPTGCIRFREKKSIAAVFEKPAEDLPGE